MGWMRELSLLELPQAVGICAEGEKRVFGFRVLCGALACVPAPLGVVESRVPKPLKVHPHSLWDKTMQTRCSYDVAAWN